MNDRARSARQILKSRTRTQRAASQIRRNGVATLATHVIAAGLGPREARTVASSLRKNAAKANVVGIPGISYAHGRARQCRRFTPAEVARIAVIYKPRKDAYRAAARRLVLAA